KRVAVTLVYLSTDGTIDTAASIMGISKTCATVCINQVLLVLVTLAKQEIQMPSTAQDADCIRRGFESIAGFSDVIGPIDGSLILICRPAKHEGWYCRKNYPVVNMQAVIDHKTRFRSYCIRAGSMHNQALWNQSGLRNSVSIHVPSGMHLLGDAGYKIFRHMMTPFQEEQAAQNTMMRRYNFKHSQTRITIERAFGVLKNRYRILLGKVQKTPINMARVIISCLVLHNLMIKLNDSYPVIGRDPNPPTATAPTALDVEDGFSHEHGLAKQLEIMEYLSQLQFRLDSVSLKQNQQSLFMYMH
ncbi:hypothetical protein PHMEG_00035133, partial [Phytophthora megakarya]